MPRMIKLTKIAQTILDEDEREVEQLVEQWIDPSQIKSFNERRNGKHGTRINYMVGGVAVQETPEEVLRLLEAV